jgi:hypothetical protein
MARRNETGLGLSGSWSAWQRTYGRGQPHEVQSLALEGIGSVGKPIPNGPLGAALQSDLDEARIAAVKAAQKVDGVGHIPTGMPTNALQKSSEVQMARGSVASDPGELGPGYADRQWFG